MNIKINKINKTAAALIAVALLLTGCSKTGAQLKPDGAANAVSPEDCPAPPWTEEELDSTFLGKNEAKEILASVPAEDEAYDLVGVVMYTEDESGYIRLAFMDAEGYCQSCGLEAVAYEPLELEYLGEGRVSFNFLGESGEAQNCVISFSREGSDVFFKAESWSLEE